MPSINIIFIHALTSNPFNNIKLNYYLDFYR
nr:MAG TPA: hypothetical protein [Caudoviricetes sp.]